MRIFVDMDGTLAKWNTSEDFKYEQLYEKGYFLNLSPNEDIVRDVNKLINQKENVYILSSYLTESKYALSEKQEWVKQHLPELPEANQIFVPYGINKAEYIAEHYSPITNDDYLIDDYTQNLLQWKTAGGIGVKYINGINHTRGTWKGLRIYGYDEEYRNLIDDSECPALDLINPALDLINLVISEKLKKHEIAIITAFVGYGNERYFYTCIYKSRFYFINQVFEDNIDDIINAILAKVTDIAPYIPVEADQMLADLFYKRHYPTLFECKDFNKLIQKLSSDTIDCIENSVFLWDETDKISYGHGELVLNDDVKLPQYYDVTISWYTGAIDTDDFIMAINAIEKMRTTNMKK